MNLIPAEQYDRKQFIGGSAISAILGISKWKTPVQLYYDMVGWPEGQLQIVKPEVEKRWKRGKRLEPVVLEMIGDEQPHIEITARSTDAQPNRYVDPEIPYFAAEVDFEWRGTLRVENAEGEIEDWLAVENENGEIKTVHPFMSGSWGNYGSDEMPLEYLAQAQWGLGVTGRRRTIVAALFGADNLVLYRVERDEALISMMRDKAIQFWELYIRPTRDGTPRIPEPKNADDVTRIFPKDNGSITVGTPDSLAHVRSLRTINAELKLLTAAQEGMEFLIKRAMGASNSLVDLEGNELATWKGSAQKRLDNDLVKTNYPDVYKACTKTIEFRRFLLKGKE
jgi:predicted phage-related endonuclease